MFKKNKTVGTKETVLSVQRQDARIIVGLFYEDKAGSVFCEVTASDTFSALNLFRDHDKINHNK